MERHELLQYLKQPALLSDVSMEELQRQVDVFPYAANLRLLLLLKARQRKDPNYEQYLTQFAAVTFDRPHLFDLVHTITQSPDGGEVLELLELSELELAPLISAYEQLPSRLNEVPLPPPPPTVAEVEYDASDEAPNEAPTDNADPPEKIIAATTDPEPPERFVLPLPPGLTFEDRMQALRHVRPLREVPPPGGALSETLADLLVRQGQPARAIEMYRRLGLVNPEKKAIFAGLIQELKQKI